jgi:hypothetical protein
MRRRYKVIGIGETATASVCTNNGELTDFGLFNLCNSQICNGFPPISAVKLCSENEALTYSWMADKDVPYYIHVRADMVTEFTITVTGIAEEPEEAAENESRVSGTTTHYLAMFSSLVILASAVASWF